VGTGDVQEALTLVRLKPWVAVREAVVVPWRWR
jgi:hypothetical protein